MISILDKIFEIMQNPYVAYGIFWIWVICIPLSILAYIAFLITAKIMWKKEVKKYSAEKNRNKGFLEGKLEYDWDRRIKKRRDDYCDRKTAWFMFILISFMPYFNVLLLGGLIERIIESIKRNN